MASEEPPNPMAESGVTIRSDSEQYSAHEASPPSSSSSPGGGSGAVVLYRPPTIWSIIRGAAINLLLPFINGMMLGFGELFAHEAAFRLGWSNTRVRAPPGFYDYEPHERWLTQCAQVFPESRRQAHPIGPGIEVVEKLDGRNELDDLTSLE
ncbi:hypothetical protein VTJ49DRAFT_6434 [Mycothermus thermophilus]|uniref:Mitochondrial import protein 1 n=1 Tax=Humicola insolens TaxID=85995 RepID=A0ABR3VJL1_HUMIN